MSAVRTTQLPIHAGRGNNRKVVAHATILDDHVAQVLKKLRWHMDGRGYPKTSFRLRNGRVLACKLHCIIYRYYHGRLPEGMVLDHKDRKPLNVTPENVRAVTRRVNNVNQGKQRNNTSGYKGVTWDKKSGKWKAQAKAGGKQHLGLFTCVHAAARAVNAAYRIHFPDVAIPNPTAENP